jgi:hypothetical protein
MVFRPVLGGYLVFMYLLGLGIRGFCFGKEPPRSEYLHLYLLKNHLGLGSKNIAMARYDPGGGCLVI